MDSIALDQRQRARAQDRRIAGGALRVGLLVLVAKLAVAAREIAVAAVYGTGRIVDAYNLAFSVVTWVPIMLTAALGAALVPALVRLRSDSTRYQSFASELNGLSLAVAVALVLATALLGPGSAMALAGDAAESTGALAADMALVLTPFAGLLLLAGVYAVRLQAEERFLYSVVEALPPLLVAMSAVFLGQALGGDALLAGTLTGGVLQVLILVALVARMGSGFGQHRLRPLSPEWRPVTAGLVAIGLGQALLYGTVPLDQYVAGHSGEGAIAVLGYANRLIGIATSMGTVVLARALLPIVSYAIVAGDHEMARQQTVRWALIVLGVAIPLTALGIALTPWGVAIVLQRGAFGADDTTAVSWVVQIGLLQLPFYLGGLVVVQWLAARGRYSQIAIIAGLAMLSKVTTLLLIPRSFGVEAVMMSTVVMYVVSFIFQAILLVRRRDMTEDLRKDSTS